MLALQKELVEMKKAHEEAAKKNEEEIKSLQEENRRMKKLVDGVPSLILTNQAGRSYTTAAGLQTEREPKNNFTDPTPSPTLLWTPLSDKWKGFNRDRYDGTTNPDEHMDVYTTHMSLYTTDDTVLCRVFPTSLKGGALSWFTKLLANSVDCFETLMAKFNVQFATSRPHQPSIRRQLFDLSLTRKA